VRGFLRKIYNLDYLKIATKTRDSIFPAENLGSFSKFRNLSSAREKKKKMLLVTFDIETTGSNQFTNPCFAVGYCVGKIETDKPASIVKTGKWTLDLGKPSDKSWKEFWTEQGWEARRYDNFWSENTGVLDHLMQSGEHLPNERALAQAISQLLGELERDYVDFAVGFDTAAFDSVWIATILQRHDLATITQNRDGTESRPVYELDSRTRLLSDCNKKPTIEKIKGLDHDPGADAYNIFADFANSHDHLSKFLKGSATSLFLPFLDLV